MYFDPVQNAYIDAESGQVVYREEHGIELADVYVNEEQSIRSESKANIFSPTIARPQSYTPLSSKQRSPAVAPSPEDNVADMERQLYDMHVNGADVIEPTVTGPEDRNLWDDWSMARTLQALEFEIPNEVLEGWCEFLSPHFIPLFDIMYVIVIQRRVILTAKNITPRGVVDGS